MMQTGPLGIWQAPLCIFPCPESGTNLQRLLIVTIRMYIWAEMHVY